MSGRDERTRPKPPVSTSVMSLNALDGEMNRTLDRLDMADSQKATLYDQQLRKYVDRYREFLGRDGTTKAPTPTVAPEPRVESTNEGDHIVNAILESIPRGAHSKTKLLLGRLKDVIQWNDRGEFGYKGSSVIPGSNLVDLVGNAARPASLKHVAPKGLDEFLGALKRSNAPQSWMSNKMYTTRMQRLSPATPTGRRAKTPERTPELRNIPESWSEDEDEDDSGFITSFHTPSTVRKPQNWSAYN